MKNKTTRLLSMLLAVLMVLTVMPVIALSANEAGAGATATVWDGNVPADANGVTATVEDWVFGTGAAADKKLTYASWDAVADYITVADTTITVKNAGGLAILAVMTNVATKIGDTDIADSAARAAYFGGKTIVLAADIYLNDATTANKMMPLFWCGIDPTTTDAMASLTFDGQGHAIYGWSVDRTIEYKMNNRLANAWGFFGMMHTNAMTVKGLALLGATLDVEATIYSSADDSVIDNGKTEGVKRGGVCTVLIGGVVGGITGGTVEVADCVVDIDINAAVTGGGTIDWGNRPAVNMHGGGIFSFADGVTVKKADGTVWKNVSCAGGVNIHDILASVSVFYKNGTNWETAGSFAGVAMGGWSAVPAVNNVIMSYACEFEGEKNTIGTNYSFTAGDNTGSGAFASRVGLVTFGPSFSGMTKLTNSKASKHSITYAMLSDSFDTDIRATVGDSTTFATWDVVAGKCPVPAPFAQAEAVKDALVALFDNALHVKTPEDLMEWNAHPEKYPRVELDANIDMAGYEWKPINEWGGVFDGNGNIIFNLTSTPPAGYEAVDSGDYNLVVNMRGGLVNFPTAGFGIKDVALVNYEVVSQGIWVTSHQGMLWGYTSDLTIEAENVVIIGKNNWAAAGGGIQGGMFGGRAKSWGGKTIINNCVFVCTDPATTSFKTGFSGNCRDAWSAAGWTEVTNFYGVNLPENDLGNAFGSSNNATPNVTANNIYATGSLDRTYHRITTAGTAYDTDLLYKDTGLASFYKDIVDRDVELSDMLGDAMGMPADKWTTWKFQAPIPSAFTAKNAKYLSELITFGETYGDTALIGSAAELDRYARDYANGVKVDAMLVGDVYYNNIYTVNEAGRGLNVFAGLKDYSNTFDGQGFTIYGLYQKAVVSGNETLAMGLINNVKEGETANVKNLVLANGMQVVNREGVKINLTEEAGAYSLTDTNVTSENAYIGGICGLLEGTLNVENVYNGNQIVVRNESLNVFVGGLCGYVDGTLNAKAVQAQQELVIENKDISFALDSTAVVIGTETKALTQAILDAWKAEAAKLDTLDVAATTYYGMFMGTNSADAVITVTYATGLYDLRDFTENETENDLFAGKLVTMTTAPTLTGVIEPGAPLADGMAEYFIPISIVASVPTHILLIAADSIQEYLLQMGFYGNTISELIGTQIRAEVSYYSQQSFRFTFVLGDRQGLLEMLPDGATMQFAAVLVSNEYLNEVGLEEMEEDYAMISFPAEYLAGTDEGAYTDKYLDYDPATSSQYTFEFRNVADIAVTENFLTENFTVIVSIGIFDAEGQEIGSYMLDGVTVSFEAVAEKALTDTTVNEATKAQWAEMFGFNYAA